MESVKYLYGASGHCKVIIEILKSINNKVGAILDDYPKNNFLMDIPVIEFSKTEILPGDKIIISIGNNETRKKIASNINAHFAVAFHNKAIISESAKIDKGSVVMAGVVINASVNIGEHCIINTGSIIDHDCNIADYCHISPNVSLAGNVTIGEGTHVGIGTCVIQGVKIGKWTTIGAGSVIIDDIPDFAVVVGNPGKIIKYNHKNE
ncbi:acetyltransferase [Flavobacterium sp. Root901]|uniref:acetyltransferase n=1 Tax=Flavobacterium sp. Root901 TaxID=1736605 RepID=UPI000709197C|nr:acetyltransferase [Flavobacterium sp. Root901]KRD07480.1 acetyltransferase [Flavobacterium sp. Root901]